MPCVPLRPLVAACLAALTLVACSSADDGGRSTRSTHGGSKHASTTTTSSKGHGSGAAAQGGGSGGGQEISVVAAENTWGSIAAGLGGRYVHVTSVVADPNVDPHDYEATVANARAVSNAKLVVLNGGGYDAWMERLLAAAGGNRSVVNAAKVLPSAAASNVHLFADPGAVQVISLRITAALIALDPSHESYYAQRAKAEQQAWAGWMASLRAIGTKHRGTFVAATESIALPVLQRAGLRVVTPASFMRAISQGIDPAPRDVEAARSVVVRREVKLLASNLQAKTPITDQLLATARSAGVPVVSVFEVLPRGRSYYQAMDAEAAAIAVALARSSS